MQILVTDGMDRGSIERLRQLGHQVTEQFYGPEELGRALREFDAAVVRSKTKVRAEHIDKALGGRLRLIIRGGVGVDNIDVAYAESHGIAVRNTPCASSASVAELALGHMLSLARFIGVSNVTMNGGQWNKKLYEGTEIGGKTLGLIGFGRIARELAWRAKALGMQVIYTQRRGPDPAYPDYSFLSLEELLRQADFVSMHIPMPANKKPVLGARELALMKPTAFIINTARGGVVDEEALLSALDSDLLAGAALDVYTQEPVQDLRLCTHPKISVTPHIGGATKEAQARIGSEIVEIIQSFA